MIINMEACHIKYIREAIINKKDGINMNLRDYINSLVGSKEEKIDVDEHKEKLMEAINATLLEIECTRNLFDSVSEPELIENAIYSEEALMAKYEYLLKQVKKLELKYDDVV